MKVFKKKEKIFKKTLDKCVKQCIISRESLNKRRQILRRFIIMSKKEFVEAYAKATGETKKRAEELVNEFLGTVEGALVKGETVQFVGWEHSVFKKELQELEEIHKQEKKLRQLQKKQLNLKLVKNQLIKLQLLKNSYS